MAKRTIKPRSVNGRSVRLAVIGSGAANDRFVRSADLHSRKMLHDARMAGSVKLHCGIVTDGGGRLWAENDYISVQ